MTTSATVMERPRRRGGLVGPTILIGLGLVFLLNNLGVLNWDIWNTLLWLWPLLLIAIGLDLLIGRRSALGSLVVVLVVLLALGVAVWWSSVWPAGGQPLGSEALHQPLGEATRASIEISMGAGTLRLGAQSEPDGLIAGTITKGSRDQVQRDFSVSGETAIFKLHSVRQSSWGAPFTTGRGEILWDLQLNPEVPLALDLTTGAGTTTLDLARLQITDLKVTTGVGTTWLTLPQRGRVRANVSGGIGETSLVIPAGMAARIEATTGIGQLRVLGNYQRQGKLYISPGFETAVDRVELQVSGGIGSITIMQESGR